MPSLAFFPWLTIQEPVDFERLHLLIYKRDEKPSGPGSDLQQAIDTVLKRYMPTPSYSINEAVIIKLDNREINTNFSEEDTKFLFEAKEIITAAGLSARKFFTSESYCNRDDFTLINVNYTDPPTGAVFFTRRRDGQGTHYAADSTGRVYQPLHTSNRRINIDVGFSEALFRARDKSKKWENYIDALFGFNQANTDDDKITEIEEVVLLMGAYHRLLGKDKEDKLAKEFIKKIGGYLKKKAASSRRYNTKNQAPQSSLGEAWLREFQQFRNIFGHGKRAVKISNKWTIKEHLLIGSYIFPLLLKVLLSEECYYTLTEDDELDFDIFEDRIDVEFFTPIQKRYGQKEWLWHSIKADALIRKSVLESVNDAV
jgi:hypothetical protein